MHRLTLLAAVSVLTVAASLPSLSRAGSRAATQASEKVVVVPGFEAPVYPGFKGVPAFPADSPQLRRFPFSELGAGSVTRAALAPYDTLVLYGLRWSTLSPSAQTAINAFAATGKVLIWDADATGAQDYSTFVRPFSTTASGEVAERQSGSVVSFPPNANGLASSDPRNPAYLDPAVLVSSNHLVQDMSVMNPNALGWTPALIAANAARPSGGWILAWAYGSAADRTGLVVYAGMDADAFVDPGLPNYAVKALKLQLASPFARTPSGTGAAEPGGAGGGGSGLGARSSPTFANCAFARVPRGWTRSRVVVTLKLSVAVTTRGELRSSAGRLLSAAAATPDGTLSLPLDTRKLPSDRRSLLRVTVYVSAAQACTLATSIRVDNTAPRLRSWKLQRVERAWRLTLRTSEPVTAVVWARRARLRAFAVGTSRARSVTLPARRRPTSVTLRDRAGNVVVRPL
jgi:hypothetical protein